MKLRGSAEAASYNTQATPKSFTTTPGKSPPPPVPPKPPPSECSHIPEPAMVDSQPLQIINIVREVVSKTISDDLLPLQLR